MTNLGIVIAVIGAAMLFVVLALFESVGQLLGRQRRTIEREAETSLADMFIFVDARQMFYWNVAALLSVPLILWIVSGNPVFVIASAIALLVMPKWLVKYMRQKRLEKFEFQLPDALLMIAGSLRAGAGLNVALESMVSESPAPVSQEFDLLLREMRVGVDLDTALQHMEQRLPIPDFIMVIAGMRIAREVGGNLADILESLADTLRRKHVMEGKIKSLTAQGKIQGIVMTLLPVFLMFVLKQMEPEAMAPLFNTMIGWVTLGVIAIMEFIGYIFIRKIVNIDV